MQKVYKYQLLFSLIYFILSLTQDSYFRMSVRSKKATKSSEEEVFWLKTADSDEFKEAIRGEMKLKYMFILTFE